MNLSTNFFPLDGLLNPKLVSSFASWQCRLQSIMQAQPYNLGYKIAPVLLSFLGDQSSSVIQIVNLFDRNIRMCRTYWVYSGKSPIVHCNYTPSLFPLFIHYREKWLINCSLLPPSPPTSPDDWLMLPAK